MSIDSNNFVWPIEFSCTIVMEKVILPNYYNIKVSVDPNLNSQNNIATGFKKIRYFVENCLHNSVFINGDNCIIKTLENIDTNIVNLPSEPYDYYIGSILYQKFFTLTKKYFDINQITIDSIVGDRVQYSIRHTNECELDLTGEHWWNTDTTSTGYGSNKSWADLNLDDTPKFEPRIIKGGLSENK